MTQDSKINKKEAEYIQIPLGRKLYNIDADDYTKTISENGTITLKPKKDFKVWIEVYRRRLKIHSITHYSIEDLIQSLNNEKDYPEYTHLETIERTYKQ
jgi:ribulose-5-phosphate 4-epimerase/fuculose-1-phosphate aldolase